MKLFIRIIIAVCSIAFLYSEEYKELNYDWKQISIPNNDIPLMSLITENNELLIKCDSTLYLSNDYGISFKKFNIVQDYRIYSYQYDKNNGLYLILDIGYNYGGYYIFIYYLDPERESLNLINTKWGTPRITKDFELLNNLFYNVTYTEMIYDQYILIGSQYQVWLYDIIENKSFAIKHIDDLINDLIQKDSIYRFSIHSIKVNKWTNRIDIYYIIGDDSYNIFSTDFGLSWENGTVRNECMPYQSQIFMSYSEWNKQDRRLIPWENLFRTIDTNCNIFSKELSIPFLGGMSWIAVGQALSYTIDSLIVFPAIYDNIILISKDYGHNFDIISNLPFEHDLSHSMSSAIFKNGKVVVFLWKSKENTSEIFIGDPKSTSISNREDGEMGISPNPTSDFITIPELNNGLQPIVHKVQIFDVLGIEVMSVETGLDQSQQRIDISHLPAGVYFIRIGDKVEKFVKM